MKELLQAVVDKDFPFFEKVANEVLSQKVRTLLESYRPVAVSKFIAQSENLSRHTGGEYIFEDGSYADIPVATVRGIFEARDGLEYGLIGVQHSTELPKEIAKHVVESVDAFISASKKNFDAYVADPEGVVAAILEADVKLPYTKAKEALFEAVRSPASLSTYNEILTESWKNYSCNPGDVVKHKEHGTGTVIRHTNNGVEVQFGERTGKKIVAANDFEGPAANTSPY